MASDKKDEVSPSSENYDAESTAKKIPYPKPVFLILAMEFCERFSYYGMRAILTLYLKNVLDFSESTATVIYHAFTMLAYFTPLLGAMLADSLLGKFRTIFYLSIVYVLGNIVLSFSSITPWNIPAVPFAMIGLVLIAFGTGGIKPCVSSFGGDQFVLPQQEAYLGTFFSIFYFSINSGSLISTFVTPIFRSDVQCFGADTCYTLAFSVPAALMITALIVFLIGNRWYRSVNPTGNVVVRVVKTIAHALSRKRKNKGEKREHWLDYAEDKYTKKDINDIKIVLRVLFLYIPLPFFWALFDQQGSTWTFQASRMKGNIGENYVFYPDQMQVINPALVLIFIPIFDRVIYPLLGKCGILKKPLQRLTMGGIFAGIAFTVSGIVELQLQKTYPVDLKGMDSNLHFVNMAPYNFSGTFTSGPAGFPTDAIALAADTNLNYGVIGAGEYSIKFTEPGTKEVDCDISLRELHASTLLLSYNGTDIICTFPKLTDPETVLAEEEEKHLEYDRLEKSEDGNPIVRIIQYGVWFDPYDPENDQNETLTNNEANRISLRGIKDSDNYEFPYQPDLTLYGDFQSAESQEFDVDTYEMYIGVGEAAKKLDGSVKVELGGSYILTVIPDDEPDSVYGYKFKSSVLVEPNSLHMFWLFPQYIIMTMGEIMFSITIMDFSYSQAPSSMKSVMQSAWLMTVAFGNLIVVIIAEAQFFDKQWKEFFLFAGLMFLDMLIFSYMAYRYVPAGPNDFVEEVEEKKEEEDEDNNKEGKENDGYNSDKDR